MPQGVPFLPGAPALAYAGWLGAPALAYALWFLLGSLWAALFCEYRAFRKRLKLADHIRMLESDLMRAEDNFVAARIQNDRIRTELLKLLAAARAGRSAQAGKVTRLLRREATG